MRTPIAICVMHGDNPMMVKPLVVTKSKSAPIMVLSAFPEPPVRATPPMIADAITWSSRVWNNVGGTDLTRAVLMAPARPAQNPTTTNGTMTYRETLMPAARAASMFPPVAYKRRPVTVKRRTNHTIASRIIV